MPLPPSHTASKLALALCLCANLLPVWWPDWPAMQDAIGWVELLDIAARIDDPTTLYPQTFVFSGHLDPNSLSLWLARLTGSWIGALTLMKLLATVFVVGTPLAVWAVCRAFDRSPWLAVLSSPLVFGSLFGAGLLNYLLAVPMVLAAVALARMASDGPGARQSVALALLLVVLFVAHALAWMIAVGLVALVVAMSARTWRRWWPLWSLLPSTALFVPWWWRKFVALEATQDGRTFGTAHGLELVFAAPADLPRRFWLDGPALLRDSVADEWAWALVGTAWLGLMLSGKPPALDRRSLARRACLPAAVVACLAGWMWMPVGMHGLAMIAERLLILALLLAVALPAPTRFPALERGLLGLALAVALAWPVHLAKRSVDFEKAEIAGLPALIEALPARARLTRVDRALYNDTFHAGTLWYLPAALNALHNGGLTNDNFACTPYAALQYRRGRKPPPATNALPSLAALAQFDYLVLHQIGRPTDAQRHPRLKALANDGRWWLFEVLPAAARAP